MIPLSTFLSSEVLRNDNRSSHVIFLVLFFNMFLWGGGSA